MLGVRLHAPTHGWAVPATLVLPGIVATIAAIAWGVLATHLCNARLLSLPLPLKLLCVVLGVVPATYAMATLSSVWGSAWAMTAITNLGFSVVILMGAAGYALTGALVLVARRLRP